MNMLCALLLAATAACAIARPPGYTMAGVSETDPTRILALTPSSHQYLREIMWPALFGMYAADQNAPKRRSTRSHNDYLNQEINRIKRMKNNAMSHFTPGTRWVGTVSYPNRIFSPYGVFGPKRGQRLYDTYAYPSIIIRPAPPPPYDVQVNTHSDMRTGPQAEPRIDPHQLQEELKPEPSAHQDPEKQLKDLANNDENKTAFAFTPNEKGYYDNPGKEANQYSSKVISEGGDHPKVAELGPPRQIRQNPLSSRTKTLVAENLDKLRIGLGSDGTSETPSHFYVSGSSDADSPFYGLALIAAVGAAVSVAVIGFTVGWYTISKRAKAAADVDYPAYGVTGPNMDTSGDRKLAQSAHMYHYHHQKQQIIAMERNGMDQHNGSVSDPESEEENEEGQYTVYECPGFATTGDMEVKNPLFNDEPTPATPGKCEIVKPQPKE